MPVLRTPAFLPLLASTLGLFRHARRGLQDPSALPRIERSLTGAKLDPAWLKAYADCVGLKVGTALPPLALQLAAAPLHMAILGDPRFPFRALGLVHMSQRVTQTRAISPDATLDLLAYSTDARWERRGMSFGLVTEARFGGELVWRGETRALAPGKSPLSPVEGARGLDNLESHDGAPIRCEHRLHVPESTGRRYAAIAGDLNPIHQHALLARLFGFRRAIVHGTWTLARALALAELPQTEAFTLEATFRRPVELPSDILVRAWVGGHGQPDALQVCSLDVSKTFLSVLLADEVDRRHSANHKETA
jgi:acyl dehydratase